MEFKNVSIYSSSHKKHAKGFILQQFLVFFLYIYVFCISEFLVYKPIETIKYVDNRLLFRINANFTHI